MTERIKGIYQYRDLKTNEVVYIGKDSHINKRNRHYHHISPSRYNDQQINRVLQNNPDRYQYEMIYAGHYDELNTLEINTIAEFKLKHNGKRPKFNYTDGGEGMINCSEETSKKLSENNPRYWKGKKLYKETREKLSKAHTGKKLSITHRENISNAHNTTGYRNVSKIRCNSCKNNYSWRYTYYMDGHRIVINSVDLDKLKDKVLSRGLPWEVLNEQRIENS